jgi:anti-anti-sigma factor
MPDAPEWRLERVEVPAKRAVVYRVDGVLSDGPACWGLLEGVRGDAQGPCSRIVLNLRGVPRATSAGIGVLAACHTSARKAKKTVALSSVAKPVASVLKVVGLHELIPIFPNEEAALDAS